MRKFVVVNRFTNESLTWDDFNTRAGVGVHGYMGMGVRMTDSERDEFADMVRKGDTQRVTQSRIFRVIGE